MKKSSNFIIRNGLTLLSVLLAIAAIIFIAFPGFVKSDSASQTYSLFGFIFGKLTYVTNKGNTTTITTYNGGLSTFALISFILVISGLILLIIALPNRKLRFLLLLAGILLIAGSVCIWLIKTNGSEISFGKLEVGGYQIEYKESFSEFVNPTKSTTLFSLKDYNFGYGLICYFTLSLVAGLTSTLSFFIKK